MRLYTSVGSLFPYYLYYLLEIIIFNSDMFTMEQLLCFSLSGANSFFIYSGPLSTNNMPLQIFCLGVIDNKLMFSHPKSQVLL